MAVMGIIRALVGIKIGHYLALARIEVYNFGQRFTPRLELFKRIFIKI